MIRVSHEVPLRLLEASRSFNDYDYALVHLFEEYPEYLSFYKESVAAGRDVLLDNSVFELGEAFEEEHFAKWVTELRPTRYIIPDVIDSAEETVNKIHNWNRHFSKLPGKTIGVVQGSSYRELTMVYKEVDALCDEIAICFNSPYYTNLLPGLDKLEAWCTGRKVLLEAWESQNIINKNKKHHLLGCSLPQEFKYYKGKKWIYSLDTSNPIVHGLLGIRYKKGELKSKASVKLADLIEAKASKKDLKNIMFNVRSFKNNLI